jgi:hypothetical protein
MTSEQSARELIDHLFGPHVGGSHVRLGDFVYAIRAELPEVFWPVFLETWNNCDRTWPYRSFVLNLLRQAHSSVAAVKFMTDEAARFFDALPEPVPVYRGCARYRVRGLSWTTDRAVAMKFARGMRFDGEPHRVLAEAIVPKQAIFAVFIDRQESEIVLDPRRLRKLRLVPVVHDWNVETAAP